MYPDPLLFQLAYQKFRCRCLDPVWLSLWEGSLPQTPTTAAADDGRPLLTTSSTATLLRTRGELPGTSPLYAVINTQPVYNATKPAQDATRAVQDERSSGVVCVKLESVDNGPS